MELVPRPTISEVRCRMSPREGFVSNMASWRPGLRLERPKRRTTARALVTREALRIGATYSRAEIHEALGGAMQEYLPHVAGRVVCACLRQDENPDAPRLILPADGPNTQHWARVFAEQQEYVPVFIKRFDAAWEYVGNFRVERTIALPSAEYRHVLRTGRRAVPFMLELEQEPSRANISQDPDLSSSSPS